ncbi:MAG TPA: hypothetical protein VG675_01610 [Bryobacteraceae bacterium]|nr:hypothetical protein [Bryobacteraceae bacterium]
MASIQFRVLADVQKPEVEGRRLASGIHSGNAGDLIYSLPAVRALGVRHLLLNVYTGFQDPLRKLSEQTAHALVPLLLAQEYLDRVSIVSCGLALEQVDPECIDVDHVFDRFRLRNMTGIHLIHAHANAMNVQVDPNEPFLKTPASEPADAPYVVAALTPRYRSLSAEWFREAMTNFRDVRFLGVPDEWQAVAGMEGRLHTCRDFLEMACLIQRAALFVGTPSLASAIAEGLKVWRAVETGAEPMNAFPLGPRGHVLPQSQAEFRHLLRQWSARNPRLAAACVSLEENEAPQSLALVELARDTSRCHLAKGVPADFFAADHRGIFLHANSPGETLSELTFSGVRRGGLNCFDAVLEVDHAEAAPVRFSLSLDSPDGRAIEHHWVDVPPKQPLHWQVLVSIPAETITLRLATEMSPGAPSNAYAWSWWREPKLVYREA